MKGLSGVLLALCGVTALGCDGGETDTNAFVVPTEIAVDPLDFRGQVGCSLYPGAMRSYVMTLHNY